MPEYQAYVIGKDGRIEQRLDLVCADVTAAAERAKSLAGSHAFELWQLDRKIRTFKPGDPLKAEKAAGWLKGDLRPPK